MKWFPARCLSFRFVLTLVLGWPLLVWSARLEVVEFASTVLQSNPLQDPVTRRVAVFIPDQATNPTALPVVYYLPGYGSSSDRFIEKADQWRAFCQRVADEVAPVRFVVVDGRNRWGGSQYLNSPAQGNYADYVCNEIVARLEARFAITNRPPRRIIAGHSSGGFGALRLAMQRHDLFDAVMALSPDSDFQDSHLPLVQLPGVTNATLTEVNACMARQMAIPLPRDGDLRYALGLSAAYAPRGSEYPGQFEWLYDAAGRFRERVWQRWMDNDPLTLITRDANVFAPAQSIYLEGPTQDEYKANVGARKMYEQLRHRPARCTFYEPPGKHSEHLAERLERGLAWVFDRPLRDIR